jgi:hypothetical protein
MEAAERIAELEVELEQCRAKLKEVTTEKDEALELVDRMREEVEEGSELIEDWIAVFEMQQNDAGDWLFDPKQSELWERFYGVLTDNQRLVRQWNKFVGEYNAVVAPRERGRPLQASGPQAAEVLERHKAKHSLRAIVRVTGLSLRTVRTIVENAEDRGRSKRTNEVRRLALNRLRAAAFRARKKSRERLPQRINEHLEAAAGLVKAAKGL